ncbi:NH(3)-dependent NAD(+) synthetase [Natrinema versiforme JCM 10478]|uniref:NH(3)-dependent NAD(+) synthetase n=2 Tax=Natrinema versiforme TaxID=88724 RepID=L9XRJ9_9EURY|nr:NH(3)-dependent NAD(+) synthetase [Natrinema versiforme JCM 10478]
MTATGSDTAVRELPRDSDGLATTDEALTTLRERLPPFLEQLVADAGADGLVVRLDGSVETTVAATLAVDAIGEEHVTGLVMPAFISHEAIARNAETVAESLGIEHSRLQLQPVLAAVQGAVGESDGPVDDAIATNNMLSRLRMACTYYVANTSNLLVVGPIDRTRYLLGSATKYGETAADCLLFGDLYQTEVRALARHIGIPEDLTFETAGSPLYDGQSAIEQLDVPPETVDRILRLRFDQEVERATVADRLEVDPELVDRLDEWCVRTRHKRQQPPTPGVDRC